MTALPILAVIRNGKCMMRCGEKNYHVHDGYEKDIAPSSYVNDTDEDESNKSIVHRPFDKTSSDNLYMDVSESECNIVNNVDMW